MNTESFNRKCKCGHDKAVNVRIYSKINAEGLADPFNGKYAECAACGSTMFIPDRSMKEIRLERAMRSIEPNKFKGNPEKKKDWWVKEKEEDDQMWYQEFFDKNKSFIAAIVSLILFSCGGATKEASDANSAAMKQSAITSQYPGASTSTTITDSGWSYTVYETNQNPSVPQGFYPTNCASSAVKGYWKNKNDSSDIVYFGADCKVYFLKCQMVGQYKASDSFDFTSANFSMYFWYFGINSASCVDTQFYTYGTSRNVSFLHSSPNTISFSFGQVASTLNYDKM